MALVAPVLALGAGIASHVYYFNKGEHHMYATRYIQAFLILCVTSVVALSHYTHTPTKQCLGLMTGLAGYYLGGLYTSLIIYRLFLNALNKFPGPYLARLSKFDFVFKMGSNNSNFYLTDLHRKYGKYVRIGPNDLSITDPEAMQAVSGVQAKCAKNQWYDGDKPFSSMHTTRQKALHDRRRRVWAPAFSDKALRGYENRMQKYNGQLVEQIAAFSGQPFNASKWFNLYSYDVMGDLAFGHSYNMLVSGDKHWSLDLLSEGMMVLKFGLPIWFFRLLVAIPGAANGHFKFIKYCAEQLDNRMKVAKTDDPDIMATLLEHYRNISEQQRKSDLPMLQGDSRLIIVAGSDTTAAALTHLFYHIAADPSLAQRLREEIGPLMEVDGKFSNAKLVDAPFLNGVINETLRLHPPVPSGVFRQTPPEGITVGETFVPGDAHVQMPGYAIARDEDTYVDAESFVPERWYSKSEMIKHKDGFAPFSLGPFGCIGKNLALMELRLVTSELLMKFDVSFAPGEDGKKLLYQTIDHFTLGLQDLNLTMKKR